MVRTFQRIIYYLFVSDIKETLGIEYSNYQNSVCVSLDLIVYYKYFNYSASVCLS